MNLKARAIKAAEDRDRAADAERMALQIAESAKLQREAMEMCDRFSMQFGEPLEDLAPTVCELTSGRSLPAVLASEMAVLFSDCGPDGAMTHGAWSPLYQASDGKRFCMNTETDDIKTLADLGDYLAYEERYLITAAPPMEGIAA